jgi:hypothetical protein
VRPRIATVLALVVLHATGCGGDGRGPGPTPTPRPEPAPRPIAKVTFGINAPVLFNDQELDPAVLEAHVAHMERTGIETVRTDAQWLALEPSPPVRGAHRYDWRFADRVAATLARHGIRWWPILDYAPSWAGTVPGDLHSPPRDPADYGSFAGAFARRYGTGGAFWRERRELPALPVAVYELWNEENSGIFWPPRADVDGYADVFAGASAALAVADPRGRALVGGIVPSTTWVPRMLERRPEIRDAIGGVAVHPYSRDGAAGVVRHMREIRESLDVAGLRDVPLEVTEVGWETRPPTARWFATDERRARLLVTTWRALDAADLGIDAYLPYAWVTQEARPDKEDDWYGVVPPGRPGVDTPGTRALARLARLR